MRHLKFLIFGFVSLAIGFTVAWVIASAASQDRLDSIVAVSWGDGKYGPAFYGTYVYLHPLPRGYSVRARISIGRSNGYSRDLGELGKAEKPEEAVSRWGAIEWRDDGLHIGKGPDAFFLPRSQLENHR